MLKTDFFLGIDGGGTKTKFLLEDKDGNEIRSIELSSSNAVDIGIEKAKEVLAQGIDTICKDIPASEISMFAGIAGGITGNNKTEFANLFKDYGFFCFDNGSDAQNAVAASLGNDDGITVIMGTGSILFVQKNRVLHRFGGFGYLLEDGGSGYSVAKDAITASLKYEEGSGETTIMKDLLTEKIHSDTVLSHLGEFYEKGKRYIASFCPIVFEAFDMGDAVARKILENNMKTVASLIENAKEATHLSDIPIETVLCGGLTARSEILIPMISAFMKNPKEFAVQTVKNPPVKGAVILARRGAENA